MTVNTDPKQGRVLYDDVIVVSEEEFAERAKR